MVSGQTLPLSLRLNNPGNIEINQDNDWKGKDKPSKDSRFESFKNLELGARAHIKVLRTYREKYDLKSINDIVFRWAPPSENDSVAYAAAVAGRMGLAVNEMVPIERFPELAYNMALHEAGGDFGLITRSLYDKASLIP